MCWAIFSFFPIRTSLRNNASQVVSHWTLWSGLFNVKFHSSFIHFCASVTDWILTLGKHNLKRSKKLAIADLLVIIQHLRNHDSNNVFSKTNSESGATTALKRLTRIISLTYNSSSWAWQLARAFRLILPPCFDFCSHRVTGCLELRCTRWKYHQHQTTKLIGTTAITPRYWSSGNVLRTQKYRISGTAFSNWLSLTTLFTNAVQFMLNSYIDSAHRFSREQFPCPVLTSVSGEPETVSPIFSLVV